MKLQTPHFHSYMLAAYCTEIINELWLDSHLHNLASE